MKAKGDMKVAEWKEYLPKSITKMQKKLDDISKSLASGNPNKGKIKDIKPLFAYVTFNSEEDKDKIIDKWKEYYSLTGRLMNGCKKVPDNMKLKSTIP